MLPISVCIIVKDEEKRIGRCLSSLEPYGFETVVVDTGSSDHTKELAARYTDRIYDFLWLDDFSAARNFSLNLASNDWILMIDSDEWVGAVDTEELAWFMGNLSAAVGSVNRRNYTEEEPNSEGPSDRTAYYTDRTERFFNRRLYRYTGRIHEQLTPIHGSSFECFLLNATFLHDGYRMTPKQRREKATRNLSLLEKQLFEDPDNPYLYYQLGKGLELAGDDAKACEAYQKGMSYNPDPSLSYVEAMVIAYGHCLLRTGAAREALFFTNIRELFPTSADFLYLLGLIDMRNGLLKDALQEFTKAVTFDFSNENGANSFLSWFQIGHILSQAGDVEEAARYYRLCGDYAPAKAALQKLTDAS